MTSAPAGEARAAGNAKTAPRVGAAETGNASEGVEWPCFGGNAPAHCPRGQGRRSLRALRREMELRGRNEAQGQKSPGAR